MIKNAIDNSLTRANKLQIINWGMPDYSAIVSRSKNTVYTADTYGFIGGKFSGVSGEGKITINGKDYANNGDATTTSPMYPVSPGDTYSFTANTGTYNFWFIPCKGVQNA